MNKVSSTSEGVLRLAEMLAQSQRTVVFTGAGVSTESGIPDFRSPDGIWRKMQPIDFEDFMRSEEMRRESWRRKIAIDQDLEGAEPNRGHCAIAELVKRGDCAAVITQNIDGLHQKSGVPEECIIELHGNSTYAKCLQCELRHELEPIFADFRRDERLPVCTACGGIVKTATISFGQSMPKAEMGRAEEQTLACDLFIAIGSSLVVYPAAAFPALAGRNGARLVILNREVTDQDALADLVLHEEIGPTLGGAVGVE